MVCSENRAAPGVDDKDALEAGCLTTLESLKQNAKPGELMTVSCPKGCLGAKGGFVQKNAKNVFDGDSSVCKSGLFVGIAKENESTNA